MQMIKRVTHHFKCLSVCCALGSLATSLSAQELEKLTADASLWESKKAKVQKKFSEIGLKMDDNSGNLFSENDGLTLWKQPLSKVELELSDDQKQVQSVLLTLETGGGADAEVFAEAKKWRDAVSKKLGKKSKRMPSIQVGADDYQRIAWNGEDATVILSVVSNAGAKRLLLGFHEQEYGLSRLKLEGKQEVEDNAVASGDTEQADETKRDRSNSSSRRNQPISRTRTGTLMERFSIEENFEADWPKLVKSDSPEITIIKEDAENKKFIYHSPNYEFICDVKISKNIIKNFSTLFESTRQYCQELPLSMVRAHMPENTIKYKILLFGSKDTYFKNGGPQGSAGVYMSGQGVIMIPLTSLGVKQVGSGYMFDYKATNKTLPHEITHQLTNLEYYSPGARGWFSEGLAEYVATTAYRSGKFMVNGNLSDIRSYVTGFSRKDGRGRNIGEEFTAPDLKEFMLMSYSNFTANGNFNYGFGALVTYYFLHMDNDGDRKNINAFLKALMEGKRGEEALNVLLAGRSFDELEEAITKSWRSRGVKIKFR